jgi:GNAT superfamily N-acetyltransferase
MTGIGIGQPWDAAGWKDLRITGYREDAPEDLAALATVVNAVRGTDWPADRVARFYGHPAFELGRDARLVWLGERPVGAAICYPTLHLHDRQPGNFELFVVPEARGHGLGSRLLAHLEAAARGRGHRVLETTVDSHDAPGQRFLLAQGFRVVGQSAHLARATMADLPAEDLPAGYGLRSLADDPEAADHYRDLANRLGAYDSGYTLIDPEEMAQTAAGPDWEPGGVFVLTDPAGREVGVLRVQGAGQPRGTLAEIRLDPAHRGQGLGTALVGAGLRYLAAAGTTAADLEAPGPDSPPYRLAVRCGFAETHRWQQLLKMLN